MSETKQPGWTRLVTGTGSYEYQFQGSLPAVREGNYLEATDYQFLVMDEEGWLYRIPVRVAAEVELGGKAAEKPESSEPKRITSTMGLVEAQLRAGLERFRPRANAPYAELDGHFAIDEARAREILGDRG